jgi:hypothetical protein
MVPSPIQLLRYDGMPMFIKDRSELPERSPRIGDLILLIRELLFPCHVVYADFGSRFPASRELLFTAYIYTT